MDPEKKPKTPAKRYYRRRVNLLRLIELTGLCGNPDQLEILAEMNAFNIESRYPESLAPPPTPEEAKKYFNRADEVFQWLINQL